jgi:hypothetical protein
MGDRCYMSLYCRRQDVPRFEELGFSLQTSSDPSESDLPADTVEMIDEEANYAHSGDMPADIPFHGYHCAGGNYGEHQFACDGKEYEEWETGNSGGYVVELDEEGFTSLETRKAFQNFRRVMQAAEKLVPIQP